MEKILLWADIISPLITLLIIIYLIIRELLLSKTFREAIDRTIQANNAELSQKDSHIMQLKDHIQVLKDIYNSDVVDKMKNDFNTTRVKLKELEKNAQDLKLELVRTKDILTKESAEKKELSQEVAELNQRINELQQMTNTIGEASTAMDTALSSLYSITATATIANTITPRKEIEPGIYVTREEWEQMKERKRETPVQKALKPEK